jgi:phage gpG-like protein
MSLTFTTTKALEEKLKGILDAAQDKELMEGVGRAIRTQVELGFRGAKDPYGVAWAGLKFRAGTPLSNTRRLRNSITYQADEGGVTVGTNVCYAIVHQFGATITATPGVKGGTGLCGYQRKGKATLAFMTPGGWVNAKQVTIPARPFMPDQRGLPKAWGLAIRREINARFKAI